MMRKSLLAVLLLLLLGGAAPARDWTRTVSESAEGWTFGRPGAPLLVEYGSLGCPTCARYSAAAGPTIASRVKAGTLRYSYRPFLIFPHDRAAALLARCVAPGRRLAFLKAVLARQPATKAKLAAADADERQRQRLYEADLAGAGPHAVALAEAGGLDQLASEHGLAAPAARHCLADPAGHAWVTEADLASRLAGVTGTPTFEWKGKRLDRDLPPTSLAALLKP
jgi:protein-disulfide isomerase